MNDFSLEDRNKISKALTNAYSEACEARKYESEGNQKDAIQKWGEVLGSNFPEYTEG